MRITRCSLDRQSARVGRQTKFPTFMASIAWGCNRQFLTPLFAWIRVREINLCGSFLTVLLRACAIVPHGTAFLVDSTGCVPILHLGMFFHLISKSLFVSNGVPLSEVGYAERRAGHVIAKMSLVQVHRVDPSPVVRRPLLLYPHYYLPQLYSPSLASPHLRR